MSAGTVVLAQQNASAGPFGLLVLVLLGIAVVALVRNMDKRLKRLPKEFPPPDDERDPEDRPDR